MDLMTGESVAADRARSAIGATHHLPKTTVWDFYATVLRDLLA